MNSKRNFTTLLIISFLLPRVALGFIGPSAGQSPGSGGGKLIIDSKGNIGFGTSSSTPGTTFDSTSTNAGFPTGHGYVFLVASSTNPGIGLKNLTSGNVYLWSSRNFGSLQLFRESPTLPGLVVLEILETGHVGISERATTTARLKVGGNVEATGSFVGSSVSSPIVAGNVSSDVFGRLQGNGNFAFPASLGIATSSESGLPQPLSVYGNTYISGNVGIGTTGPGAKLHVSGGNIQVSTGHVIIDDGRFFEWGNGQTGISGNDASDFLVFYTSNVEQVRINSSGNVGIGITTPSSTLHVSGDITFGGGELIFSDAGVNNRDYIIYNDAGWGTSGGTYTFHADNGLGVASSSPSAAISAEDAYFSGSVGIGDSSPTEGKLVVAGTGYFTGTVTVATPTTGTHAATKSYVDSTVGGGSATSSFSTITVSGTSTLATAQGNVGIGTTSPNAKLDISVTSGSNALQITNSSASTNKLWLVYPVTNGVNTDLKFYDTADRVTFQAGGNVGIGDTTPTEGKLVVAGTGYFANTVTVATPTDGTHAATKSYVDSTVTGGTSANAQACSADATCEVNSINANNGNITGVNKITVTTIDPLYQIGTSKYSTYAASVVGGVKEEYVGKGRLGGGNHEYVIDFGKVNDGSDLWIWRKIVDFSKNNVDVFITPYGETASIYYKIEDEKIIFGGDKPVEFSYRLIGKRFDWRTWPTYASDQNEKPSFIIK